MYIYIYVYVHMLCVATQHVPVASHDSQQTWVCDTHPYKTKGLYLSGHQLFYKMNSIASHSPCNRIPPHHC